MWWSFSVRYCNCIKQWEILTISYLLVSDSVYDVLVTSAVEYVTDIQYNINMKLFTDLIVTKR